MSGITVRPLRTLNEIHALADLQRSAWAALPDRELIPTHFLRGASSNGNLLLGAFDGEKVVGFVLGIIGWAEWLSEPTLQLYSATMGVLLDYQSHGVGYLLKWTQRDWALQRGIQLVTWTYDPLLARNAWLNVGKLGVICGRYYTGYYGPNEDRLHVEWWLESERVKERLMGRYAAADYPPHTPTIAIPPDYLTLCHTDPHAAHQIRAQTRQQFTVLFEEGYKVVDFKRTESGGYYLLAQSTTLT